MAKKKSEIDSIAKEGKRVSKLLEDNNQPQVIFDESKLDPQFLALLENDSMTVEWIKENAAWKQLPQESDIMYLAFRYYIDLPFDKWGYEDAFDTFVAHTNRNDFVLNEYQAMYEGNQWLERRMAFMRYTEWIKRKNDELTQLQSISNFRNNQASLLSEASNASVVLVRKLAERIESLDPNEIKPSAIPGFISAISSFVSLASDAEARVLSVSQLLELFADELDDQILKKHLFYVNNI